MCGVPLVDFAQGCSNPFDFRIEAELGDVRKAMKALAAAGSLAIVGMPAMKMMKSWTSEGTGPTKSTPGACRISLIIATPISAPPFATSSKIGADTTWPGLAALERTIF
jgi:hypothetical protein